MSSSDIRSTVRGPEDDRTERNDALVRGRRATNGGQRPTVVAVATASHRRFDMTTDRAEGKIFFFKKSGK